MFFFKLWFLLTLNVWVVFGSESTEELEALISSLGGRAVFKDALAGAYSKNKLKIISRFVSLLEEEIHNITLVGTQNIYGTNGELAEIRTVELHWPQHIEESKQESTSEEDDDDEGIHEHISDIQKWFKLFSDLGLELTIDGEELNKAGELVEQIYWDKNLFYNIVDGIQLINKTIEVDSISDIENRIAELKKNHITAAVHRYNDKHEFIREGSDVVPEYVAKIESAEGVTTEKLFNYILKSVSNVVLDERNNLDAVPSKLEERLKTMNPKRDFYVFSSEPTGWHLTQEHFFKVTARYDLVEWGNDEDISFTILGGKSWDD